MFSHFSPVQALNAFCHVITSSFKWIAECRMHISQKRFRCICNRARIRSNPICAHSARFHFNCNSGRTSLQSDLTSASEFSSRKFIFSSGSDDGIIDWIVLKFEKYVLIVRRPSIKRSKFLFLSLAR